MKKALLIIITLIFTYQVNANITNSPLAIPIAVDDDFFVGAEVFQYGVNLDLLINDFDSDGDPLAIVKIMNQPIALNSTLQLTDVDGNPFEVSLQSTNGTLWVWSPVMGNPDINFTYTISDGNGGLSTASVQVHFDCSGDFDGDGVEDCTEMLNGTDPLDLCSFNLEDVTFTPTFAWEYEDCDGDGVFNGDEIDNGSDPSNPCDPNNMSSYCDSDGDGVSNAQEIIDGTNINDFCDKIIANITLPGNDLIRSNSDCDNDGLTYYEESTGNNQTSTVANPNGITSNPNNPDTDGDGVIDGQEGLDNTNQANPCHFNMASITQTPITFCNVNNIVGKVTNDTNYNGCDTSDPGIIHKKIETTDGINTYATFTDSSGNYSLFTDQGNYTTTTSSIYNYFNLTPASYSSNFVGSGNTDTANFCHERTQIVNDVIISIYGGPASPGFNSYYYIVCKNIGSTTVSGDVVLTFDNTKLSFVNATIAPTSQTASSLNFHYNLSMLEGFRTQILFNVATPPTVNNGDILNFNVIANTNVTDDNPLNNNNNLSQTVVGSYDPNDITCSEGDEVLIENSDKYLHYLIRFQNEGTADAINIVVTNILDDKLDWDTIELEGLSHDGRVAIKNDSEIEFIFENIHLPDSTTDEPNSHGFIAYKIKPKSDVVLNDIISNQADIFFDFNEAVITNISTTQFVNVLGIKKSNLLAFTVYPTPTSNILNIESKNKIAKLKVYTKLGQLISSNFNNNSIDVSNLSQGLYFIKVIDELGNSGIQKVIKK